ncbi:hypothetical protein GQ457_03G042710 [Hibiscus cannabinus]
MELLPALSSAIQRTVSPSVRLTWKMYRSCEYETLMSLSPVVFSRICFAMALAFVDAAVNSASTTDPRATRAYNIAI